MNIPLKLTLSRVLLAPVFFVVFMLPVWTDGKLIFATTIVLIVLYIYSEISDALDGHIARKFDMVTDEGKILDPFSDVILHITYFSCFVVADLIPVWMLLFILYREVSIGAVRNIAVQKKVVLQANIFGKIKTVLYAIVSLLGFAFELLRRNIVIENVFGEGAVVVFIYCFQALFISAICLSFVSFFIYLYGLLKKRSVEN